MCKQQHLYVTNTCRSCNFYGSTECCRIYTQYISFGKRGLYRSFFSETNGSGYCHNPCSTCSYIYCQTYRFILYIFYILYRFPICGTIPYIRLEMDIIAKKSKALSIFILFYLFLQPENNTGFSNSKMGV